MNNEEKILAMLEKMDSRLDNLEKDVAYLRQTQDKHTDLLLKAVSAITSMDSVYSDRL